MAQVEITINGRSYLVGCDAGQEDHIGRLARYMDQKVAELVQNLGQVGDARLAVMAGLLIADELADTDQQLTDMRNGMPGAAEQRRLAERTSPQAEEPVLAFAIDQLAQRIENIATQLEGGNMGK